MLCGLADKSEGKERSNSFDTILSIYPQLNHLSGTKFRGARAKIIFGEPPGPSTGILMHRISVAEELQLFIFWRRCVNVPTFSVSVKYVTGLFWEFQLTQRPRPPRLTRAYLSLQCLRYSLSVTHSGLSLRCTLPW